ncbi:hypothetical protein C8J56DRAFT_434619 [Mycena floridula]|nr:hypothetical protein C8J56DRAFT_434619 [Mycena floridula]
MTVECGCGLATRAIFDLCLHSMANKGRITFLCENRTFERLLKETTLAELQQAVRSKLGITDGASIKLAQLRSGKTIDLEDDDDFEAFRDIACSLTSVEVEVKVIAPVKPANAKRKLDAADGDVSQKPPKKKKKEETAPSVTSAAVVLPEPPVEKKKKKVNAAASETAKAAIDTPPAASGSTEKTVEAATKPPKKRVKSSPTVNDDLGEEVSKGPPTPSSVVPEVAVKPTSKKAPAATKAPRKSASEKPKKTTKKEKEKKDEAAAGIPSS